MNCTTKTAQQSKVEARGVGAHQCTSQICRPCSRSFRKFLFVFKKVSFSSLLKRSVKMPGGKKGCELSQKLLDVLAEYHLIINAHVVFESLTHPAARPSTGKTKSAFFRARDKANMIVEKWKTDGIPKESLEYVMNHDPDATVQFRYGFENMTQRSNPVMSSTFATLFAFPEEGVPNDNDVRVNWSETIFQENSHGPSPFDCSTVATELNPAAKPDVFFSSYCFEEPRQCQQSQRLYDVLKPSQNDVLMDWIAGCNPTQVCVNGLLQRLRLNQTVLDFTKIAKDARELFKVKLKIFHSAFPSSHNKLIATGYRIVPSGSYRTRPRRLQFPNSILSRCTKDQR